MKIKSVGKMSNSRKRKLNLFMYKKEPTEAERLALEKLFKKIYKPKTTKFVIVRKLIDNDGIEKSFTYYPRKVGGSPPFMYKTKEQAEKALKRGVSPSPSKDIVVEYKPEYYLNRWS